MNDDQKFGPLPDDFRLGGPRNEINFSDAAAAMFYAEVCVALRCSPGDLIPELAAPAVKEHGNEQ